MDIEGNISDPEGGQEDCSRHLIRAVGNPEKRFGEDALRILRGLRFCSTLGFDIEDNTFDGDKTIVIENPDSTKVVLMDENGKPFLKHEFGKNTVIWIWSVSGAPYICIEPWSGSTERFRIKELEKKNDIIKIDPGKKYMTESIISVF